MLSSSVLVWGVNNDWRVCSCAAMVTRVGGADTVQRILDAGTLFGRLGLPRGLADISEVKRQYRQLALVVHPDKCNHVSAKEAFQKLSEAFDCLANETSQKAYLKQIGGKHDASAPKPRRRHRDSEQGAGAKEDHWWDTRTWEEFEKRFRHRDAAEAALRTEFESGVKAKHMARRVRDCVLTAERSVEHCDRASGFPNSELWPPKSRVNTRTEEDIDRDQIRPELDSQNVALERLLDLLTHLRTVHRYCLYCGCVFDSFADLERNCPGFTEEDHNRAPTSAAKKSKETAMERSDQLVVFEPDPLDEFMAGVQDEVTNDMRKSVKQECTGLGSAGLDNKQIWARFSNPG